MPNTIGFQISIGSLPEGWSGDPQALLDAVAELLQVQFDEDIAVFSAGSQQPETINNRAWLRDGTAWYVPDGNGGWRPADVDSAYKRIYVRNADPFVGANAEPVNPRSLWLKTNIGATVAESLSVYLNGSWRTLFDASDLADVTSRLNSVVKEDGGLKDGVVTYESIPGSLREQLRKEFLNLSHPVGSIYENAANPANPQTLFNWPESEWEKFGEGRVTVGEGTAEGLTARSAGESFGAESVTLDESQVPDHDHSTDIRIVGNVNGQNTPDPLTRYGQTGLMVGDTAVNLATLEAESDSFGGGGPHNNMQPSVVVYRWRRTA